MNMREEAGKRFQSTEFSIFTKKSKVG